MLKKILPILLLPLLLAGCATNFANLSPSRQPRNANNLYPVEVAFNTRQQTLRWETIQPYVVAGSESYPMHKVGRMNNRWEALLPVPTGTDIIAYRYKFDFQYSEFGGPVADTAISPKYELQILDQ